MAVPNPPAVVAKVSMETASGTNPSLDIEYMLSLAENKGPLAAVEWAKQQQERGLCSPTKGRATVKTSPL